MGSPKPPSTQDAPVLYRARVRKKDGEESTAFAVVADAQVHEGEAGQAAVRGPAQFYRFKVRTADGTEFNSAIAIVLPKALASRVQGPEQVDVHFYLDVEQGSPLRSRGFQIVSVGKTVGGRTDAEGAVSATIPAAARAQLNVPDEHRPLTLTLHVEHLLRSR